MAGKKRSAGPKQGGEPAAWVAAQIEEALGSAAFAVARLGSGGLVFADGPGGMKAPIADFIAGISRDLTTAFSTKARSSKLPFGWTLSEETGLQDLVAALPSGLVDEMRASTFYVFFRRDHAHGDLLLIVSSKNVKSPPSMEKLFACQGMAQVLFDEMGGRAAGGALEGTKITRREKECLGWSAEGKTSEEIAMILSLSTHTVNHYLLSAIKKLNAVNRMHAIAVAFRTGVLAVNQDRDPI